MNQRIRTQLIQLNRQFYQTFAGQFTATRQRLQPGVLRVIESLPQQIHMLDLGCGNGELWRKLAERGHTGFYLGLDFSAEMLAEATQPVTFSHELETTFYQADLTRKDWVGSIPEKGFDIVVAFAVLHHLPGQEVRRRTLRQVYQLLHPRGLFAHSEWQFLNSKRLRERIQPWEQIGLAADQVDPGDYLLDWRRGGLGLRYAHSFTEAELEALARDTGFQVKSTFYSDGHTGDLGLYQTWQKNDRNE